MDDEWRHGNILKIVLSGGDADTNAAVAGAILGAKFGICHIPDELYCHLCFLQSILPTKLPYKIIPSPYNFCFYKQLPL